MPSPVTVARRSESGTVSLSSTLSAFLVRASISSSWVSVSREVLLAVLGMDGSFPVRVPRPTASLPQAGRPVITLRG